MPEAVRTSFASPLSASADGPLLMQRKTSIGLLCTACLFAACGGDAPVTSEQAPLVIGGDSAAPAPASIYQMPTPNELFTIVRALDGTGDKSALSPLQKADRFATLGGRALNFGVYATDMVYASNFKITSEVVRYYLACKVLGEQLGLTAGFDQVVQERLERNLTRGDSLDVLTNDAYYAAYQKLQEDRIGPTLSLVLAGGWLESMHLVFSKVQAFDAADPLVLRIAEQKVGLEQLVDMMEPFQTDPDVAPLRSELIAIRSIYDQLNVVRKPHEGPSASGRMVIGDDVSVSITADKFDQLKQAVVALRTRITRPEDSTSNP